MSLWLTGIMDQEPMGKSKSIWRPLHRCKVSFPVSKPLKSAGHTSQEIHQLPNTQHHPQLPQELGDKTTL